MGNSEYLDVFLDESQEHLQAINDNVLQLEQNPDDLTIVGEIFRSAHTLKGMAATMGFEDLANLTHYMENVLDLIRNDELAATTEIVDVIFLAVDDLEAMITDIAAGGEGTHDVAEVVDLLVQIEKGKAPVAAAVETEAETEVEANKMLNESYNEFELTVIEQSFEQGYSTYQIKVTLDEQVMLKAARVFMVFTVLEQIGEVIKSTPSTEELEEEQFDNDFLVTVVSQTDGDEIKQRIMKVSEVSEVIIEEINQENLTSFGIENKETAEQEVKKDEKPQKAKQAKRPERTGVELNKTIRVNIERLDVLMNLFEELVIDRGRLEQIASELRNNELNETVERMSRISGDLQQIILHMRMMPVEQVFNRFPRMVRNLSRDLNKKVNLEIIGAETELDRTIIDEIGDPLVHLIRNSIDHGIETPDVRKKQGKPEVGTVQLKAYHSGNNVYIEIKDDGAGIDRDVIIEKAIANGTVTEEDIKTFTSEQIYGLLFSSGLSTAEEVTDVSGRGVGLDVVRSKFESLGGVVSVDSTLGEGSVFSIQLPLTLSIIDVMLVELEDEKYAIPLSSIVETAIINKKEIYSTHNQKVIDFRGKVVPLVFLKDVFELEYEEKEEEFYSLVIVHKGDKVAGLVVDSLIGQYDIVLKSLGNYLKDIFAISGATILGDGEVALIIDSNELIK